MASYVPSQVVELLDLRQPYARRQCEGEAVQYSVTYSNHGGFMALLVRMVDRIPEHLLTLRGSDAIEFGEAMETIRLVVGRL